MNIKYSCVIDSASIFKTQALIFIKSLLFNGIKPKDIYIHTTEITKDDFFNWLEELGVNVLKVTTYDKRNKYCNKLVQLKTFQEIEDYDYVFLMDCDTSIVSLEGLELEHDFYSKIVDFPNPPIDILKGIYAKAELTFKEAETSFPLANNNKTEFNNCNGGLYIFSKKGLNTIAPHWIKWSNWCIDNADLFTEHYSKHADQVGFALAMSETDSKLNHLDMTWNYPIHVNKELLPNIKPNIIHFHNQLDNHMKILPVGLSNVDKSISVINEMITNYLSTSLDNRLFWNNRYKNFPELDSGVGSRGEILDYKKQLLSYVSFPFINKKILDVGCGDLELTKSMPFKSYLGIDISNEALELCKQKKPQWSFENKTINELADTFNFIMCFDVLIHQSSKQDFENLVKEICDKSDNRVLIGAYDIKPEFSSDITYYYKSFVEEVKRFKKFNEFAIVGKYRDVTVLSASINKCTHKRDIKSDILNRAYNSVSRPDLLQYLVDVSRVNFNFYTSHYPRVFEYTWLLEHFEEKKSMNVLDIGAGVCPLPICLTEFGHKVTTVDSHPLKREIKDKEQWNEWGFLDYSLIDARIKSKNIDFGKFRSFNKFDCIYSISVIEHMPRVSRLKVLKKASRLLKKHGKLLLTIDIEPKNNTIWNHSENKKVEDESIHGTIESFTNELNRFGFDIYEDNIQRNIDDSRTDVWYIKAILNRKPLL
jgi:2-polyprenyl-3-methyl-5-hydroxy-6-metoxy-1,4-benzoquinol methylase